MELLDTWPALLFLASGILGLLVGSFLNVVAYRLPIMMELDWRAQCDELAAQPFTPPPHAKSGKFDLTWPPSACPGCGKAIAPQHNVPVVSFLFLRGRCPGCGTKISARYPIVEASAGVLALVVAVAFGASWQTVAALGFTWTLLALTLIDLDHKLLPDSLTLPLLWAGLLIAAFPVHGAPLFTDLFSRVLGAIGAWTGWQMLPLVILLSAGVGAVIGIAMIAFGGRSRSTQIPFGPYLAAAGFIALLWGEPLIALYERTFFPGR